MWLQGLLPLLWPPSRGISALDHPAGSQARFFSKQETKGDFPTQEGMKNKVVASLQGTVGFVQVLGSRSIQGNQDLKYSSLGLGVACA